MELPWYIRKLITRNMCFTSFSFLTEKSHIAIGTSGGCVLARLLLCFTETLVEMIFMQLINAFQLSFATSRKVSQHSHFLVCAHVTTWTAMQSRNEFISDIPNKPVGALGESAMGWDQSHRGMGHLTETNVNFTSSVDGAEAHTAKDIDAYMVT
jgi:hypothetical protein